jgi:putative hydrolase of the HAD superfamily
MQFSTVFFDLDDTLYPSTNGLWEAIRERMNRYMGEILNLPSDKIPDLRRHYFITYGTTLRGLQYHHNVDAEDFLPTSTISPSALISSQTQV